MAGCSEGEAGADSSDEAPVATEDVADGDAGDCWAAEVEYSCSSEGVYVLGGGEYEYGDVPSVVYCASGC